ncbi:TcpQ domain-containing protein [Pseudomonas putida]|uniref:TcpQ domain-containing protein n=1 Tax=Pseudomonas putida TaxID=303 RepID=A0A8I1ECU3_PSEPU|nr:TcpQ domain-containing protein [Pseudomonas putida]MBI6883007.1 TcpQ domain-containing protein [Pseudomonas putida]
MAHKLKALAGALAGIAFIQQASAELYISPVLRDSVEAQPSAPTPSPAYRPAAQPIQAQPGQRVVRPWVNPNAQTAPSTVGSVPSAAPVSKPINTLFGRDVPLKAALEILVPNSRSWSIVYEPGVENKKVSWRDVANWKDALGQISRENGIIIGLNENAKRIAVTYSAEMAQKLAQPGNNVWVLQEGLSLRENLIAWGKIAGWEVDWSDTLVDYPIDHSATLVGQFSGKGGVVDRVLAATAYRETPLIGNFYKGNHVVVITNAGYNPEKPSRPQVDEDI